MMDMEPETKAKPKTPARELDLIRQVGEWAEKNFGHKRWPELGVIEEIGEASHAILKHHQGIRGFEESGVFKEKLIDALADAVIFLCDWCSIHNAFFQFDKCQRISHSLDENLILKNLLQNTSQLFTDYVAPGSNTNPYCSYTAQQIIQSLMYWAGKYDIDLPLCVSGTWATVSKRDWKLNPKNADTALI